MWMDIHVCEEKRREKREERREKRGERVREKIREYLRQSTFDVELSDAPHHVEHMPSELLHYHHREERGERRERKRG